MFYLPYILFIIIVFYLFIVVFFHAFHKDLRYKIIISFEDIY